MPINVTATAVFDPGSLGITSDIFQHIMAAGTVFRGPPFIFKNYKMAQTLQLFNSIIGKRTPSTWPEISVSKYKYQFGICVLGRYVCSADIEIGIQRPIEFTLISSLQEQASSLEGEIIVEQG
jgi:hypothetical protein